MHLSYLTILLLLVCLALPRAQATNLYPNSSFEQGLPPLLSGGENRLVEGKAFQGKRYASSRLERIMFMPVPVPAGVTQVTVSAYLRSGKGSGRVVFGMQTSNPSGALWATETTLGLRWTRYTATFPVSVTTSAEKPAFLAPVLWNKDHQEVDLDAIQIEFGELTNYAPLPAIETRAWTGKYGNIFDASTAVDLKAGIANSTARPLAARWEIAVVNHKGEQVYRDANNITLAPGAQQERAISLGQLAFGHYTVKCSVSNGTECLAQQNTTFARVAARPEDKKLDKFGIHVKYVNEPGTDDLSADRWGVLNNLGAGWARLWCSWREVEAVKGAYNWSLYDAEIGIAKRKGQRILGVFYNRTPRWAGPDDMDVIDLSANTAGREAFIRAFVGRYKDVVDAWEIFNEPYWAFSPQRKLGRGDKFIADYAALHRATYRIIKELDPTAPTITNIGDSEFKTDRDWAFFLGIAEAGLLNHTDAVSTHEYDYKAPATELRSQYETAVARIRQVLASHQRTNLPIWMTEGAITTDDQLDPRHAWYERLEHFMKTAYVADEWKAAKALAKGMILRRACGYQKEFFFNLSQPGPSEGLYAPFRNRWEEPKVVYPVQVAVARTLGDTDFCCEDKCDLSGGQVFLFKEAGRVVAAYWTEGATSTLTVTTPANMALTLVDLMGNAKDLVANSKVSLPLDSEPRFVVVSTGTLDSTVENLRKMLCQVLPRQ